MMSDDPWRLPSGGKKKIKSPWEKSEARWTRIIDGRQEEKAPVHRRRISFKIMLVGGILLFIFLFVILPTSFLLSPGLISSLIILGLVGASLATRMRQINWPTALKYMFFWALIFAGLGSIYNFAPEDAAEKDYYYEEGAAPQIVELDRSRDGHYRSTVWLNDKPVKMIVDTGASEIVLNQKDARDIGVDTDRLAYNGRAETANGSVALARVRVDRLRVGTNIFYDVPVSVSKGEMRVSLLGMSLLSKFSKMEFAGNKLTLHP